MKTIAFGIMLLSATIAAAEPDCVNLSPRELGSIVIDAAAFAASQCPEAPACVCPEIPRAFVLCRQSQDGKVVRCKRYAWKTVTP